MAVQVALLQELVVLLPEVQPARVVQVQVPGVIRMVQPARQAAQHRAVRQVALAVHAALAVDVIR
jgi:hypothetical protein